MCAPPCQRSPGHRQGEARPCHGGRERQADRLRRELNSGQPWAGRGAPGAGRRPGAWRRGRIAITYRTLTILDSISVDISRQRSRRRLATGQVRQHLSTNRGGRRNGKAGKPARASGSIDGLVVTVDGRPLPEHYEVQRFRIGASSGPMKAQDRAAIGLGHPLRPPGRQGPGHQAFGSFHEKDRLPTWTTIGR